MSSRPLRRTAPTQDLRAFLLTYAQDNFSRVQILRYSFAFNFKQFLFSELACDLDPCLFTRLKCLRDCQSWSVSHRLTRFNKQESAIAQITVSMCQWDLQRQCSWFLISPRRTPLYSSFCQGAAGRFYCKLLCKFVEI